VGTFVGTRRCVITEGDVVEAVGVVDAVDVGRAVGVAETGVCVVGAVSDVIAGDVMVVDAAADDGARGFAVAVGNTEGNGDGDGDALPCVGVAIGGVFVCDIVGFGIVGVAMCAVTGG